MDARLLIAKHPTLYHMAEAGTWPSICAGGLLSAEALLDALGAEPDERLALLRSHRPKPINHSGVFIRDQKPMNHNLRATLRPAGILPEDWLAFLNRKVFFWTSVGRLEIFHQAYRAKRQLFIEIPTEKMVAAYGTKAALCHINSGATRMPDHFRSFETFQPIASFPYSSKRKPVEFTIDYEVKDVNILANRVYESGGGMPESILLSKR